ncbi:MAG: T9SS type A sorting domain-containing protein [Ignavibacteria bacterium]|nr:T9SS type A sorting domain-containing protein [Ignavibacteria bacterium]
MRFDAGDLPSGVYFYRMETENFISTKKLILLK